MGRAFLSRRDRAYLLSLLVPLAVYDLALKVLDITSLPDDHGLASRLDLMRSGVFFVVGYALLWIGLFAAVRRWPLRWILVFFFHAATMLVMLVIACAHHYFQQTGAALDYTTIAEGVLRFQEIGPIFFDDVSLLDWILLAITLSYVALGPLLVTRAIERWRGWPRMFSGAVPSPLGSLGFCLLALGFGSLSLITGSSALARDPLVNMVATGFERAAARGDNSDTGPAVAPPPTHAILEQTSQAKTRNVVLIHLESTRARSVTPYNKDLKTTPFLDELAKSSLLAERAYVVVPRSSKGTVAVNCGIDPALYPGPEFGSGGIPAPCLPQLLNEQGYRTVFFTSVSNNIDNFWDVVKNLGYKEYYPSESMDADGFQKTNTFGYEEAIMLKPSEEWLKAHKDEPFMAEYMTGTGHYGYECVPNRYGTQNFSDDDQLNRYLNCLNYLDSFVKDLMDQYKELGLYDNTIFVLFGDHGEGFGEHGRFMHGDTIWEEGLRIPLIIHAPGWFENGDRAAGLSNETDILPTVLEMLGYEVKDGEYPGYSLLHPLPEDRTLRFSCITNHQCLASIQGYQKYIYHYGHQPEEVFDLSKDPLEEHNLADEHSKEDLDKQREDLIAWDSKVNAGHGDVLINGTLYSEQ